GPVREGRRSHQWYPGQHRLRGDFDSRPTKRRKAGRILHPERHADRRTLGKAQSVGPPEALDSKARKLLLDRIDSPSRIGEGGFEAGKNNGRREGEPLRIDPRPVKKKVCDLPPIPSIHITEASAKES